MKLRLSPAVRRRGYTLLEVILALAIGVFLLAGLYMAMHVQYEHVQAGRDVVEQSTLAHSLMDRLSSDISRSMGPVSPANANVPSGGQSATGQGATGQGTTGQGTTGATGTTGASSSTTSTSSTSTVQPTYNLPLSGDADSMTLYVSRERRDLATFSANASGSTPTASPDTSTGNTGTNSNGLPVLGDLRRISYKLVKRGESDTAGLMRQDTLLTTGYDNTGQVQADPDQDNAPWVSLAEEVEDLHFQYLDPQSGWVQQWPEQATGYDSSNPGPFGPPLAVEIRMTIFSGSMRKTYRHVVSILTADGAAQQSSSSTQSQNQNTTNSNGP